jgi:hypothetical protein
MFSTSSKDIVINTLHCRIPINVNIPIGVWVNLSIDVLSFVSDCFKFQTFRSIDYISITANCKIRRIFSMRNSLMECNKSNNEDFPLEYGEILPKNLALPADTFQENINYSIDKVKQYLLEGEAGLVKNSTGIAAIRSNNLNNNNEGSNYNNINNFYSESSQIIKKKNKNEILQLDPQIIQNIAVTGTYNGHKKSNILPQRNTSSPKKYNPIRSKSHNRPLKTLNQNQKDIEMLGNKEDVVMNGIRFLSKSPEGDNLEENSLGNDPNLLSTNVQVIRYTLNKNKRNQMSKINEIKNNPRNFSNNQNNILNIKKLNYANKDYISAKKTNHIIKTNKNNKNAKQANKLKIPENEFNKLKLHNEEKDSNLLLFNTLNYKNIEKWENSKDNLVDSIEEIFDIDDKKNVNSNRESYKKYSVKSKE